MYRRIHLYIPCSVESRDARFRLIQQQWYENKAKMHALCLATRVHGQQYDLIVQQHRRIQRKLLAQFETLQVESSK